MSSPYVGEIRMFGGNFAPSGWAFCDGQTMPISQNDTLFTLIGTTYGGDGQETFNLPDLQGRFPLHQGQGPGISQSYQIGEKGGVESVTLSTQQIPIHTHAAICTTDFGQAPQPEGAFFAQPTTGTGFTGGSQSPLVNLNAGVLSPAGGSQPHENMSPFLCVNFILSLFGIFPTQN